MASASDASSKKSAATADAEIALTTGHADADRDHAYAIAAADKVFATGEAAASKNLTVALAGIDKAFALGHIGPQNARAVADRAAQIAYWDSETAASGNWNTATGVAWSTFRSAEYSDRATAMSALASAIDIPWTRYRADLATTQSSWWESLKPSYLAWLEDANILQSIYQTGINAEFSTLATALISADNDYMTSTANAEEAYATSAAGIEESYATGMAAPTETYLLAKAQSDRDQKVSSVLQSHGRDAGALANYSQNQQTAFRVYAAAEALLSGQYDVGMAGANLAYVQSSNSADLAWTTTTTEARKTYAINESTAYASQATQAAGLARGFRLLESQSYSDSLSALATSNGTPWATQAADQAIAALTRTETFLDASYDRLIAAIASSKDEEIRTATADADRANSSAETSADQSNSSARNEYNSAVTSAASTSALAAQGLYSPQAPSVSETPLPTSDATLSAGA